MSLIIGAHEGSSGSTQILRPGPGGLAPRVADGLDGHFLGVGKGLAVKGNGGDVDRLAGLLTGGVGGLAGDGGVHGLGVGRVVLAHEGGGGAAVVLRPLPGGFAPIVAGAGHVEQFAFTQRKLIVALQRHDLALAVLAAHSEVDGDDGLIDVNVVIPLFGGAAHIEDRQFSVVLVGIGDGDDALVLVHMDGGDGDGLAGLVAGKDQRVGVIGQGD